MPQVFACTTVGELTTVTYLCPRFSSFFFFFLFFFFFFAGGGGGGGLFLVRVSHGRLSGKLNTNCGLVTILNLLCS